MSVEGAAFVVADIVGGNTQARVGLSFRDDAGLVLNASNCIVVARVAVLDNTLRRQRFGGPDETGVVAFGSSNGISRNEVSSGNCRQGGGGCCTIEGLAIRRCRDRDRTPFHNAGRVVHKEEVVVVAAVAVVNGCDSGSQDFSHPCIYVVIALNEADRVSGDETSKGDAGHSGRRIFAVVGFVVRHRRHRDHTSGNRLIHAVVAIREALAGVIDRFDEVPSGGIKFMGRRGISPGSKAAAGYCDRRPEGAIGCDVTKCDIPVRSGSSTGRGYRGDELDWGSVNDTCGGARRVVVAVRRCDGKEVTRMGSLVDVIEELAVLVAVMVPVVAKVAWKTWTPLSAGTKV